MVLCHLSGSFFSEVVKIMIKKMLTKTLLLVISGMVIICGSGCFIGKISQATEDTSKNKIEAAASYIEWSNSGE